jgi:hypothetical protein
MISAQSPSASPVMTNARLRRDQACGRAGLRSRATRAERGVAGCASGAVLPGGRMTLDMDVLGSIVRATTISVWG